MMMVVYGALVVVGVVLLVVAAVRVSMGGVAGGPEQPSGSDVKSARDILEERFATDELSAQEYQRKLRVLEGETS